MPPFVTCQISRHGKRMYYFRRKKGKRTRLPELGTDAFWPAYQSALMSHEPPNSPPLCKVAPLQRIGGSFTSIKSTDAP